MVVCDQRFSDLRWWNYTPSICVKSEKSTPLKCQQGLCSAHALGFLISPAPPHLPEVGAWPEKWGRKNGRTGPKHHGADAPGKAWTRGSGGQALQLACLLGENDSGLFHAVSQRQDSMEASEGPQANTFIELSVSFFLSASLFRLLSKVFLAALSN